MEKQGKARRCENGHSFDIAKENYVNLLTSGGSKFSGDNTEMTRSRRDFLSKGYYKPLADTVGDIFAAAEAETFLDICCGEGYYTAELTKRKYCDFYGFDISKEMVRLAAKRKCGAEFFVANLKCIPVKTGSVDFALHLFAPFDKNGFFRVMRKGGTLITSVPGKDHLSGLKAVLYETPYPNDEKPPDAGDLTLTDRIRVKTDLTLNSREDIAALFRMTPYYYNTPRPGAEKLFALDKLETPIDFLLFIYKK